ncbi:RnfABCDGE type electron transport complex subunit G [Metapseudomonas lalkuanensis]|jgi:electron transport complex protein RnfG|uniref:Ion-translocating oxidoreductase complex subunit G n=1 Tax=Metapseudomonas lalkuanensis TaxID=2604832 RepID=A0A5J6QMJ9_9GAMM|nr:RnfABCDGE type electron transport complex subunit G [Pseudomonas lalkuanensis]QEY61809.1 RnfABCDGE type electron transport complex subunit G [Pseudomonas lalkuanensis]UCO99593.1 RnfABCDGE type electron transport complex subunit G [Pseudomonas lalkuanensis]
MKGRSLAILAALAGLGLAVLIAADQLLAGRIDAERQAADERALLDLLPPGSYDNHPLAQPIPLPESGLLGSPAPTQAWLATREGVPVAVLLPATAKGYEGPIRLLLAIRPDGRLLATKVLGHRETPGIGDRIEPARSAWLRIFTDASLASHPEAEWRVKADKGEFDEIVGATITSRAVVSATQHALQFFDGHRLLLLGEKTP